MFIIRKSKLHHSTSMLLHVAIIVNSMRPLRIALPNVADVDTVREPRCMLPPLNVIILPTLEPPSQWKYLDSKAYPVRR